MNSISLMSAVGFLVGLATATTYPVIDANFTVSFATNPNVSRVDISKSTYDRNVLEVNGKPFFYNGVQIRADNLRILWDATYDDLAVIYQSAADAGFTVVNSQMYWLDIQPDYSYPAADSTYIQGGNSESTNFADSEVHQIGYSSTNTTEQSLMYMKFDFSDFPYKQIDAAKIRIYVTENSTGSQPFTANLYGISNKTYNPNELTWPGSTLLPMTVSTYRAKMELIIGSPHQAPHGTQSLRNRTTTLTVLTISSIMMPIK
jgi:hypothetical protein